ncbi:hypothetical protein H7I01_27665 [Mycobacterium palustre]|nr:hypothetical protein [Mycobacterium palustre]
MTGSPSSGGSGAGVASAASGPTPTPPALKTTTSTPPSFFAAGSNELRGGPTPRESGIPASGFFNKPDRGPETPNPGIRLPEGPE